MLKELAKEKLPPDVELFDGGTASMENISILSGRRKVIIIDTVEGEGEPGAIYRFNYHDVKYKSEFPTSQHQLGIIETLKTMEFLGTMPDEVVIIGIQPQSLKPSLELTPKIAALMPKIVELVLKELP